MFRRRLAEVPPGDFIFAIKGGRFITHKARAVRKWTRDERDVYVYFDNDAKVHAPADARRLLARLTAAAM